MKITLYREIIDKYNSMKKRNCIPELLKEFPEVPEETMDCIIYQEYQRKMQNTKKFHVVPDKVEEYYSRYLHSSKSEKPGFLLKLADEVDLSPAFMAKIILEHHYKLNYPELNLKEKIEKHLKDTSLIQDGQLALEITLCQRDDQYYGYIPDVIRSSLGIEYELNLRKKLTSMGVSYLDEESLRSKGFDKTPDIRLEIPIAIGDRVINWIESKASFGDIERHKMYLEEQYSKYKHRFGPGMVIYWFGFIDELTAYKRKKLIINDHMPENITLLKVLPNKEKTSGMDATLSESENEKE